MNMGQRFLLGFIKIYQLLFSSLMGRSCRYYPTCSSYAAESIRKFGALRGMWLGTMRICRCHPFCDGGHDPVPEHFSFCKKCDTHPPKSQDIKIK